MKKNVIKKFLIFLFSFYNFTFAAVVSDNDGSAFITKSEFEALRKDFASQINDYNSSIDKKIDGAIESYLKAIDLQRPHDTKLYYADWEKVTALNYPINNAYKHTNIDLTVSMLGGMKYDKEIDTNPNRFGYESWWAYCQILYDRPLTLQNKRLLCDAGTESSTYPDYVVWNGYAYDYNDSITAVRTYMSSDTGKYGYLWGSSKNGMALCYATKLLSGYYPNLSTANVWVPRYIWLGAEAPRIYFETNNASGSGYRTISDTYTLSNTTQISLNKDSNNKTTTYDHIINYNNVSYDYFSDVDWVNHLTEVNSLDLTRETWLNAATKNSKYSNLEFWNPNHRDRNTNTRTEVSVGGIRVHTLENLYSIVSGDGTDGRTTGSANWTELNKKDTSPILSVGLIPKTYDSAHIYQTSSDPNIAVGNNNYKVSKLNLYQGFILGAVNVDNVIEWEPKFIDTYSNGVASDFELNISLSTEPFGEGNTVSSNDKLIIFDGQTTATPLTTTNKTCKMKFTMPQSGIIYMKWWPADTNIQSSNWEASLDIKNCDTYIEYSS